MATIFYRFHLAQIYSSYSCQVVQISVFHFHFHSLKISISPFRDISSGNGDIRHCFVGATPVPKSFLSFSMSIYRSRGSSLLAFHIFSLYIAKIFAGQSFSRRLPLHSTPQLVLQLQIWRFFTFKNLVRGCLPVEHLHSTLRSFSVGINVYRQSPFPILYRLVFSFF